MNGGQLAPLADHPRGVEGDHLRRNRTVDDTGNLADHLAEVSAALGNQGRVGGDAVDQAEIVGGADFADVGGVDKEFHDLLLV